MEVEFCVTSVEFLEEVYFGVKIEFWMKVELYTAKGGGGGAVFNLPRWRYDDL